MRHVIDFVSGSYSTSARVEWQIYDIMEEPVKRFMLAKNSTI
jgi:hypothetical protein